MELEAFLLCQLRRGFPLRLVGDPSSFSLIACPRTWLLAFAFGLHFYPYCLQDRSAAGYTPEVYEVATLFPLERVPVDYRLRFIRPLHDSWVAVEIDHGQPLEIRLEHRQFSPDVLLWMDWDVSSSLRVLVLPPLAVDLDHKTYLNKLVGCKI